MLLCICYMLSSAFLLLNPILLSLATDCFLHGKVSGAELPTNFNQVVIFNFLKLVDTYNTTHPNTPTSPRAHSPLVFKAHLLSHLPTTLHQFFNNDIIASIKICKDQQSSCNLTFRYIFDSLTECVKDIKFGT